MAKARGRADIIALFIISLALLPFSGRYYVYFAVGGSIAFFFLFYYVWKDSLRAFFGSVSFLFLSIIMGAIFNSFESYYAAAAKELLDVDLWKSIYYSYVAAAISSLLGVGLSLPLAYLYVRERGRGFEFLRGIVEVPVAIPHTVAGIILLGLIWRAGQTGNFVDTFLGIILAMFFVSVPLSFNYLVDGLSHVDPKYEYVARSLGATSWQAFFKVILPQIKEDVLTGLLISWARGVSEFGAVIIISTYPVIAPLYAYRALLERGLTAGMGAAVVIMATTILIFYGLRRAIKWRRSK